MMRILLLTFGTEGDVRPFAALGRKLIDRGHEAAVCTADGYAPIAASAGVPLLGFGDEWLRAMAEAMAASGSVPGMLRHVPDVLRGLAACLDRQFELARGYAPDVVVFHPKPLGGPHLAERLGVPGVLALPLPMYHPTGAYPPSVLPRLPRPLWPAGYALTRHSTDAYRPLINRLRSRMGLPRLPRGRTDLHQPDGSPRQVLYAYSPAFLPVPPEYPPTVHVTGWWTLPGNGGEIPEAVRAFVAAGPADLYIGFGSMALGGLRERASQAVAGALAATGLRAVVSTGWGGLDGAALPPNAIAARRVPHEWLFPQVKAVVHHAGSGTLAGGLRAGRPTLACPVLGDQPFWGAQVHARGLGPAPIPLRRLTATTLATAFEQLLHDGAIRTAAALMAEQLAAEEGTATAATIIERLGSSSRKPRARPAVSDQEPSQRPHET